MIVKLDDFLRRRSKIALVVTRADVLASAGLREACRILFGDEAEEKLAELLRCPHRLTTLAVKRWAVKSLRFATGL